MMPITKQPLTLIVNVLTGNTAELERSISRSMPYRAEAPSAPPSATPTMMGMGGSLGP
jgi:hypothetical protein